MTLKKEKIITVLKTIPDPELNISIWDLGLIYDVTVGNTGDVLILMTLTSIGCPLFSLMEEPIKETVGAIPGVTSVTIELTFEPAWTVEKMSKFAHEQLGM